MTQTIFNITASGRAFATLAGNQDSIPGRDRSERFYLEHEFGIGFRLSR